MNRRRFFAVSLPALLGWAAPTALAENKLAHKPAAQRVEITVSLSKPTQNLKAGNIYVQTIILVTEEDVETYTAFLQTYTYKITGVVSSCQEFGPSLRVTPHIETSGEITLDAEIQFKEPASHAPAGKPLPINSNSLTLIRTVKSGEAIMVSSSVVGGVQEEIVLSATVLKPQERA